MAINLDDYQLDAISKLKVGSILVGGVGSGKSRTGIGFYFLQNGGCISPYERMRPVPQDLYIITTARKRDKGEWLGDLAPFCLSPDRSVSGYPSKVVIDSWNNIGKYRDIEDAFFIFDEQRVVGYGAWTKNFLNIAKHNDWILMTATPGDRWEDYIPVFIANGFYKNKTDFERQHCYFNPHVNYRQIAGYIEQGRLIRYRNAILVDMDYHTKAIHHDEKILCEYDRQLYRQVIQQRWNPFENKPIENGSQFCYLLRRVVNSDPSRIDRIIDLAHRHPKMIVFYNYDYELELLRNAEYPLDMTIAELNSHNHDDVPTSDAWLYLVQYAAGAEAWNCTTTDAMVFYSQSYSYKTMTQAKGRIDRRNSKFTELYYYHLKSNASIDFAISRALKEKKDFNERRFYSGSFSDTRKNFPYNERKGQFMPFIFWDWGCSLCVKVVFKGIS